MSQAQLATGEWRLFSGSGSTKREVKKVVETKNYVYSLVNTYLYRFSKNSEEFGPMTTADNLSDMEVTGVYSNPHYGYVVITYGNSAIDIIDDNGVVYNISNIKNANITGDKKIYYVSFYKEYAYVATGFGYVVLNGTKKEIKESHIYNVPMRGACVMGDDYLVLASDKTLYWEPITANHTSLANFKTYTLPGQMQNCLGIHPFESYNILLLGPDYQGMGSAGGFEIDFNSSFTGIEAWGDFCTYAKDIQLTKKSIMVTTFGPQSIWHFHIDGSDPEIYYPGVNNYRYGCYEGDTDKYYTLYLDQGDNNGFSYVQLSKSESAKKTTILNGPFKMIGAPTISNAFQGSYNNGRYYVMNTMNVQSIPGTLFTETAKMSAYDPTTLEWTSYNDAFTGIVSGKTPITVPFQAPVFDPEIPNTFYIGTYGADTNGSWKAIPGLHKFTDNTRVASYGPDNSTLVGNGGYSPANSIQFDKFGNLWVVQSHSSSAINILPAEKRKNATTTKSDWITYSIPNTNNDISMHFYIAPRTQYKIFTSGDGMSQLVVHDDNGTINTRSDDRTRAWSKLIDQDGKIYASEATRFNCFVEDNNGRIWVGTQKGVFEFNPAEAFSDNFHINHIKVPRGDGSDYADYLLENIEVVKIVVDGANRKWICTNGYGLYLVRPDGSQIISHFTKENSPLPGNTVSDVVFNPIDNKVLIITTVGMAEYSADVSVSNSDYNDVYVYPNPVRPDYTGYITIRGLMNNSYVVIRDVAGNTVGRTTSNGGMAIWDGNGPDGNRVPSGVYYIFASQTETEPATSAVSKILIVR